MKKKYEAIVFDADHTLLNYIADEKSAFARLYAYMGVPFDEELWLASRRASEETWTDAGMYDVTDPRVQARYHEVYRTHVEDIFKRLFLEFPRLQGKITPKRAGEIFLENLETGGETLEGATELLQTLSKDYPLYIATNGLSVIQRGRLREIERYFQGLYISEEVGAIKPAPAFFLRILKDTGLRAESLLMVGDSLTSDIAGANGVGVDGCWYNPRAVENKSGICPEYEIRLLGDLTEIL